MSVVFGANELPRRADMFHDEATALTGAAIAPFIDVGQVYNHYAKQWPEADGDSWTHSFFCKAGVYTLYMVGRTGLAHGLLDLYLDGTIFSAGNDFYSNPAVKNVVFSVAMTVLTDGYHTLRGTVNGKNVGSTSYTIDITKLWIKQAAD